MAQIISKQSLFKHGFLMSSQSENATSSAVKLFVRGVHLLCHAICSPEDASLDLNGGCKVYVACVADEI